MRSLSAQDQQRLDDDVRKLLGKPPYDGPDNIVRNDNYFAHYLNATYGADTVAHARKRIEGEGRRCLKTSFESCG